ncbi:MAG: hypothetical protein JWP89_6895 [Schlesneria sp.]|nr:hypothetical protein [Schlesneria sp.]
MQIPDSALPTFTIIHVGISLVAIISGFAVVIGLLGNRRLDSWTAIFLMTTVLTSVTGFLFPFKGVTPGIIVGIVSMATLALAIFACYVGRLDGRWRKTFVIYAVASLYFNVFVLIVQSFQKVGFLNALAPHQSEPPFLVAQAVAFFVLLAAGWFGTKQFRDRSPK